MYLLSLLVLYRNIHYRKDVLEEGYWEQLQVKGVPCLQHTVRNVMSLFTSSRQKRLQTIKPPSSSSTDSANVYSRTLVAEYCTVEATPYEAPVVTEDHDQQYRYSELLLP